MEELLIIIGKVIGTYGNRGWVRVLPLTDFPERFFKMDRVILSKGNLEKEYFISEVKQHKNYLLIDFQGISDMNAAELLVGALLQVTREQLVKLPADNYFIFDIIGLFVYTETSEYLGKIEDVLHTGANDVYVVRKDQLLLLIPALKQVVKKIDLENCRMIVKLPEGLEATNAD
ncbi:MAG TPA: 16S rRNA processing protein RimM [Desulfotomaculum sp.]|nr:16S rRNA processing protein RimM [Desulfotomaculum sp.]